MKKYLVVYVDEDNGQTLNHYAKAYNAEGAIEEARWMGCHIKTILNIINLSE